jgi:hypothetical protein
MTARKKLTQEELRAAINVRALIRALERHARGTCEMSPSQVNAALALLKKALPDMAADAPRRDGAAAHEDALRELE